MSGHSKWASIKRQKGKTDAARGRLFNRLIREISVAARAGGGDTEGNARLRAAVASARASNMPNKNIENAIAKGTGQLEGVAFEEVTFEGYGPGGVAVLVESMTDNRNRTVAEVRHVFTKAGGNLGATNSVNWMFKAKGVIRVEKGRTEEETLMEVVLEAGAEDMVLDGDAFEITTEPSTFEEVRAALDKVGIKPESAELTKIPENTVKVDGETARKLLKLVEGLDELDDTQRVFSNFDVGDEDLEALGTDT
jgi:YebC/PmpR family DNA-binding regulatory protein